MVTQKSKLWTRGFSQWEVARSLSQWF